MGLIKAYYKWKHPGAQVPYWAERSVFEEFWRLIRKFICQNIAPNCVTNFMRVNLYRLCGFKIGKHVFIGMKCYLDDLCYDKMEIGSHVIISYGVYFACHGRNQNHNKLIIKDGAYIGMRASIIARQDVVIGERAIVGAQTLVNKSIPDGKTAVGIPCRILEQS